jgi:PAS domain S-box-containing protein
METARVLYGLDKEPWMDKSIPWGGPVLLDAYATCQARRNESQGPPMVNAPEQNSLDLVARGLDASFADHPLGYLRIDSEPRVLATNEAYYQMTGLKREEIVGHTVKELLAGVDADEVAARIRQVRISGWARIFSQHRAASGSVFSADVQIISIPVLGQSMALLLKTEEKPETVDPAHQGGRFRRLVERQGDGFTIVDGEERITFANAASEAIFGVPPGTLVGRSLFEFLDPGEAVLVAEKTDDRKHGKEDSYELRIRRADGQKRLLFVSVTRELDQGGNYLGSVGVFRDITDRRLAEDRLRASEVRFRTLVEDAPMAIAMIRDGCFLHVNRQFRGLLGFDGEEALLGRPILDLVHHEDRPVFETITHPSNQDAGAPVEMTFRPLSRGKGSMLLHTWVRSVSLDDGPALLGFFDDITFQRKAEEEREGLIQHLTQALAEVRQLSGLLPICSHCKKVRDDKGYWNQIEAYITERSQAQFSHGFCPDCAREYFPNSTKRPSS